MDDPIYLNHAGTSWPKPIGVRDAVSVAMTSHPMQWPANFEKAHASVCAFFGVAEPEHLLLTPGCTSSLSAAMASIDLSTKRRVLTSRWEHHAVYGPLQKLADSGVKLEVIPEKQDALIDLDALEQSLAAMDVALVAVTAACNVTGELLPIERIVELSHRHDALVLIDAAQIVGWVDLKFDELGADMVAFGGHKGLQAPWGIGGLYVADSSKLKCATALCAIPDRGSGGTAQQWGNRPGYCDVGSVDQFSLAGLHAALQDLGKSNRSDDLRVARDSVRQMQEVLASDSRVTIFGSREVSQRMPTIAFSVAGEASGQSAARLLRCGLIAGSGLQCSPASHEALGTSKTGLTRLSVGVLQSEHEVALAIERLKEFIDSPPL